MKNDLKTAFDKIHAEDDLKNKTALYLQTQINKRERFVTKNYFKTATIFCVIFVFIAVSVTMYFMPYAYVDMDVNPSVGFSLNRLGYVIQAQAYNDESKQILNNINIRFKKYDEASQILLDEIISNGYLSAEGIVSLTVQSQNDDAENNMLGKLGQAVSSSLSHHHINVQTDIYAVSQQVRDTAHDHFMTPAKYIAITELQELDDTITFDDCAKHSISELKELTLHHNNHHDESGNCDTDNHHHD